MVLKPVAFQEKAIRHSCSPGSSVICKAFDHSLSSCCPPGVLQNECNSWHRDFISFVQGSEARRGEQTAVTAHIAHTAHTLHTQTLHTHTQHTQTLHTHSTHRSAHRAEGTQKDPKLPQRHFYECLMISQSLASAFKKQMQHLQCSLPSPSPLFRVSIEAVKHAN